MPTPNEPGAESAPYRSARRAPRRTTTTRGASRRLTVRSELKETPDVRKIARAIITMAVAQAEHEAGAQHEADDAAGGGQ